MKVFLKEIAILIVTLFAKIIYLLYFLLTGDKEGGGHEPKNIIHYDSNKIDYTITAEQIDSLKNISQNHWKDFSIGSFAIGIPCFINSIVELYKQQIITPTISFNINFVVGIIGIVLGSSFLVAWLKTKKKIDDIINNVKGKPGYQVTEVGEEKGMSIKKLNALNKSLYGTRNKPRP